MTLFLLTVASVFLGIVLTLRAFLKFLEAVDE
jgi:hypothetical protein